MGDVSRKTQNISRKGPQRFCNYLSNDIDPTKPVAGVAVATNGNLAFETFSSQKKLGYAGSLVQDRANWMANSLPTLGAKPLSQLVIPGSHDAGTYVIRDCSALGGTCNSKTQIGSIYDQLQAGARYFDIRPVFYKRAFEIGHFGNIKDDKLIPSIVSILGAIFLASISDNQGCDGAHLSDVLNDVARFLKTTREVVILKFSHYYNRDADVNQFNNAVMTALTSAVTGALFDYFYFRRSGSPRLANTPLNMLIADRKQGIVLPVFDVVGTAQAPSGAGLYSYLDFNPAGNAQTQRTKSDLLVYDMFADKNNLKEAVPDQVAKLSTPANHGGDLFLYSWTLTQGTAQSLTCNDSKTFANDILTLARTADMALGENITTLKRNGVINGQTIPNIIYLDAVSGFAGDAAVWLNQRLYVGDTLLGDQRGYLSSNDSLVSANGRYQLTYGRDGDLVLLGPNGRIRSVSNTKGKPTWRCVMQGDGNFVVYSRPYDAAFASDTVGNPGAKLVLSNTGTLNIVDAKGKNVKAPKLGG